MRYIDKFSDRLDQIFEQGQPTKAQILDAFHKAHPCSLDDIDNYNIQEMKAKKQDLNHEAKLIMRQFDMPESWQSVLRKKLSGYGFLKFRLDMYKKSKPSSSKP